MEIVFSRGSIMIKNKHNVTISDTQNVNKLIPNTSNQASFGAQVVVSVG